MKNNYGEVVLGAGNENEKHNIINYLGCGFANGRWITISEIDKENHFTLIVENPESTGRNPSQKMLLSGESLVGIAASIMFYLNAKGIDFHEEFSKSLGGTELQYSVSDNLKPLINNVQ